MNISPCYSSSFIAQIKEQRKKVDPNKKDLTPTVVDLGRIRLKIARHFGFCFGVENAINTVYQALGKHDGGRVFLISEMIHNPLVNNDLVSRGVRFIFSPDGAQLLSFSELCDNDVVIIPAFGSSREVVADIESSGAKIYWYDATCPFVQKVWKRAKSLGENGFTVVIHGKHQHEETKATFSHAANVAPAVIIRDLTEASLLSSYIKQERSEEMFASDFQGRFSEGFSPVMDLNRLGVVNQTTMLAGETSRIADVLRDALISRFGASEIGQHFNDARDTLCYATAENQSAVKGLVESGGDVALVIGGYNSSNTSHLVEICQGSLPTYYIQNAAEIISKEQIRHFDLATRKITVSSGWCPFNEQVPEILIAAGASCPDIEVEKVIQCLQILFN